MGVVCLLLCVHHHEQIETNWISEYRTRIVVILSLRCD